MYLIIPLLLILGSLAAICAIIWRKFPYLKKLSLEAPSSGKNIFSEWFPEIGHQYKKINLRSYREHLFKELEKFLRRLRIWSLKFDRMANSLITKIRTSGQAAKTTPIAEVQVEKKEVVQPTTKPPANYKREEQLLILEIAKNPKNPELYKKLAEVYVAVKNFADAKESLETALELSPQDEKIKERLESVKKMLPT